MAKPIKAEQINVPDFYDDYKTVVIKNVPITAKGKKATGELYLVPKEDNYVMLYCNGVQEVLPVCFDGPDDILFKTSKVSGKIDIELTLPVLSSKDIEQTIRNYFEPIMKDMVRVLLWFCQPYIDENGKLAIVEVIISRDNSPYTQKIKKIKPVIDKKKVKLEI